MTEPSDADIKRAIATVKRKRYASLKAARERATAPAEVDTRGERDRVTKEAVDLLNAHPAVLLAWKQSTGKFRGAGGQQYQVAPSGLPDICFVLRKGARFGALEAKRPGVKAEFSQAQLEMARELQLIGAVTGTITEAKQAVEIVDAAIRQLQPVSVPA